MKQTISNKIKIAYKSLMDFAKSKNMPIEEAEQFAIGVVNTRYKCNGGTWKIDKKTGQPYRKTWFGFAEHIIADGRVK